MYRGFILRRCNDEVHYKIYRNHSNGIGERLITIVGSYEKAKQWVDNWYKIQRLIK